MGPKQIRIRCKFCKGDPAHLPICTAKGQYFGRVWLEPSQWTSSLMGSDDTHRAAVDLPIADHRKRTVVASTAHNSHCFLPLGRLQRPRGGKQLVRMGCAGSCEVPSPNQPLLLARLSVGCWGDGCQEDGGGGFWLRFS